MCFIVNKAPKVKKKRPKPAMNECYNKYLDLHCCPKTIKTCLLASLLHWVTCSFTMNMGTVVSFESIPHTLSCSQFGLFAGFVHSKKKKKFRKC